MKVTTEVAADLLSAFRKLQSMDRGRDYCPGDGDEYVCECNACKADMQRALEEWDPGVGVSESECEVVIHPTAPRCPRCRIGMDFQSVYHYCEDSKCACHEQPEPEDLGDGIMKYGGSINAGHEAYRCPKCMELYIKKL